jgi:hypothetical protein
MSQDATISTNKNEATITFAPGAAKGTTVLVKTNSSTEQHIQLNIDGTETSVAGSGERNTILKCCLCVDSTWLQTM